MFKTDDAGNGSSSSSGAAAQITGSTAKAKGNVAVVSDDAEGTTARVRSVRIVRARGHGKTRDVVM